jgi:muramoyltetrapeptide carboxypeptidase
VSLRKARALQQGSRIGVVSPTSPFARDEFERGLEEIERLGFVPVFEESVFDRQDGYLSGPPASRAAAFMRHWTDPDIGALIAVRGGYGSVQILPLLDGALLAATPKLFIGYSDNTSILSWLTTRCGVTALHGPMLDGRLAKGAAGYDERSFVELLSGGAGLVLAPPGMDTFQAGEVSGPLVGGTITQIAASLGTSYAFDPPEGCVLFLEDVNERPYRLDRLLTQLALAGIISRAAALVFGEMRGCDEPGGRLTAHAVVRRMTRDFNGPVVFGFPSGHTSGPCWTLPLGVRVRLTTDPCPAIVVEESPVE